MKRGDNQCGIKYRIQSDLPIPPNWKQFLSIAENKANLADYYSDYLNENAGMALRDRQTLFIGGGQDDKAIKITNSGNYSVQLLKNNQEEADTRICLHARVAAETGSKCIVVSSPDTDVLVLLLHHRNDICVDRLFFLTGRGGKHANLSRFIPIHNIYDQLSKEQLSILLAVYCLTGCDTTSSFWGHGKKAAFRIMMSKSGDYQDLALLGKSRDIRTPEKIAATRFVGTLYREKNCNSLNTLRCEKASGKCFLAKKLPHTHDRFPLYL